MKKALDGICKNCNIEITYFGYASGNKYAEGECQKCGEFYRLLKKEDQN